MTQALELDGKRVLRAQDYIAIPIARGQYRVVVPGIDPSRNSYYYYVQIEPHLICYCSDATYRDSICKHIIAALFEANDPRLGTNRAILQRAYATRKKLPYSAHVDPDEPYPDTLSLEEALARHASDETAAQSRRLTGRIITDTMADLETLRQVARRCSRQSIRAALLRIPMAEADKEIRSALIQDRATALIIGRLLPTANKEEFRALFCKLIEIDMVKMARDVAEEYAEKANEALQPVDLLPLLKSPDPTEREFGLMMVGRLAGSRKKHEAERPVPKRGRTR